MRAHACERGREGRREKEKAVGKKLSLLQNTSAQTQ
jgi:hypothetical protein